MGNIEIIEDFISEMKDFEINKDTLEIIHSLEDILAEREQDKKRIQDLEKVDEANRKVIAEQCDYIQNESIPKQEVKEIIEIRKEKLIRGKSTYTNKIRINELNLIRRKLLEEENFDNLNPTKEKEAMAVATLPETKEVTIDSLQEEITKAINKQIGINVDIREPTNRSGQARMMEFGG